MGIDYIFSPFPVNLDKIALSGQCFRWQRLSDAQGLQTYSIVAGGGKLKLSAYQDGRLTLESFGTAPIAFWKNYLDLDANYTDFWARADDWAAENPASYIARAVEAGRGMLILNQDIFETLITFIISQNNNIPRIRGSIERLCRRLGREHNKNGESWYDFPAPELLSDKQALSECGLGYRDKYIAEAAARIVLGDFNLSELKSLSFAEAKKQLKKLKGVGDKVADCICLYSLGHKDAFPSDVWIKRITEREFPAGFPFERCTGFAGFMQQLIFYYERNILV